MSVEKNKTSWRSAGLVISVLFLVVGLAYQQTLLYLASLWGNISIGEYAHGYLVLAISIYLIFINRKRLMNVVPCPQYAMLPILLIFCVFWFVAVLVDVEMLQAVALLLIIFLLAWVMLGRRVMRLLAFPILFMVFAIPVWFPLSPALQNVTADAVFWMIRLLQVPAFREENMIVVPAGTLSIEEACSGLRYLLAALTLGSLYGYINYSRLTARITVVLVAAAAAVLSNIIRVFIVVYLGYSTDMEHPLVHDHLMLGWYLFAGMLVVLLFFDAALYKYSARTNTRVAPEVDASISVPCDMKAVHVLIIGLLSLVVLLIGPIWAYQLKHQDIPLASDFKIILPDDVRGWEGPINSGNNWLPQYHGAIVKKQDYLQQQRPQIDKSQVSAPAISLFVAYYPVQKQGVEIINDLNRISVNKRWRKHRSRPLVRSLAAHDVNEQLLINNQGQRRLVWYWYNTGGSVTVNRYQAKGLQLLGLLTGEPQAYMTAVSMLIQGDADTTRQYMNDFAVEIRSLKDLNVEQSR